MPARRHQSERRHGLVLIPAPPCPPTASPVPNGPTGTFNNTRPTFSWSSVYGAASYTLYVLRVSDDAFVIHQTDITGTSFTPTTPLPTDVDLRWKVKSESSCGPGPYSPAVSFKVTTAPPPSYYLDTDGDGSTDSVTILTNGIQILHSATGRTSSYSYPSGGFSVAQPKDTDGVAGTELIVIWTGSGGQNGVDVIHDRSGTKNRYTENRSFAIYGTADTDGVPGNEIVIIWSGNPGVSGIDVIHDRTRKTNNYRQNRSFSLNSVVDTDGVAGDEIVITWAGSFPSNGVDIIHDATRLTKPYALNRAFAIGGVRDYDGVGGAEVCYSWVSGSTRFSLIVDRTRSIVATSGC